MRLRTLVGVLCLATAAGAAPGVGMTPAPVGTPSAPGWRAPPPPKDDAVLWNGVDANILVVTDKGKAELEARPDLASLRIVLRHGATDAHAAAMVAKLPWITSLVTDEPVGLTTLASLAKLRALKALRLLTNHIASLSPLAGHPSLVGLTVTCNAEFADVDLTALATIPTLEQLELRHCHAIKDFTGLEKLTKLAALTSWDSPVTRLDPLASLMRLKSLVVRNSRVTDLSPLAQASEVRHLDLTGIKAASFAPIRSMTKLASVTLDETNIASLDVITSPDVYNLQARDAKQLATLAGLPSMPKLTLLGLDGTGITTIEPLAKLTSLNYLSFDRTAVVHIGALHALSGLKSVSLPTAVPDAEIIALRGAISGISILRFGKPPPGFVPGPPIP